MTKRHKFINLFESDHLKITAVSQGMDNYAYILTDPMNGETALIDAMEARTLLEFEEKSSLKITTIFNTHHHGDHVGANRKIFQVRSAEDLELKIYGSSFDHEHGRIPHQTHVARDGDEIHWGSHKIRVFEIPGHTSGHIGYHISNHFFCGDTVFLGGCGRLFEGTPPQMYRSLHEKIGSLDRSTHLYPAHEYSLQNMRFAASLMDEESLRNWSTQLEGRLQNRGTTLPTTLDDEFRFNPFFRVSEMQYRESLACLSPDEKSDPIKAFSKIRSLKDHF